MKDGLLFKIQIIIIKNISRIKLMIRNLIYILLYNFESILIYSSHVLH